VSGEREAVSRAALLGACRALWFGMVLLPLTAYRSPLTCQAPRPSAFQQLRDSLATKSDTTALRFRLLASRRSERASRHDVSAALHSGLLALRLGELKADPDFGDALSTFRDLARKDPDSPEAWHGLGLAEAGRAEWEMSDGLNLGSRVGFKALERSAAAHQRALRADATHIPAALALAQIELSLLDTARLALARNALRRVAAAVAPGPAQLLLVLGRVERAAGSLDSAVIAFERYLVIGANRPLGLLELARTRLALGRADGEMPYYEGASLDDPEATAGYRMDLQLLAADSVMGEFDRLKGQARAAYLHRFWSERDHIELRREGERLREHYRRILFARVHFPLTVSRRFYGRRDAYRSGNTEVDDRGVIYIRQGEPAERLRPFVFGAMPNESWHYVRSEGDLLFHFSAGYDGNGGGDLYDYRLVQSVLDLHGAADAPRDQLILSRQSLSPLYSRMLNWGRFGSANAQARERNIGATSIAVGTTTDSYELQFARRLAAVADLISVGRNSRGSLGHFVFGIAAAGTSPQAMADGVEYSVRVRLAVLDRHGRLVSNLDTTVVIRLQRQLAKNEWLVGRAELVLPPGRWTYHAALQQGDSAGVVLPRDSVRVGNPDGISLGLSDIALGTPGRAVTWINEVADTVLLAPSSRFRMGAEIELYYEASGAKPGLRYRHEITVLRASARSSDRRRPLVALSFDEEAADSVVRSRRLVRLERLKTGSYAVEVRVTAPDGSSQARRRLIRLIDR
jgi:GWxTD domain-containing protein